MPQTEREQVVVPGQLTSALASVTDLPTPPMPDGSLHGLIQNLTFTGTGFVAPADVE